ncbi:MAG: tRNA (5-methylaminomethyl-2-thiouridine)(34)-methyltransferase MnmD [Bacteroidia bacterium]|nr:tRNA (5-methylaminomethyl-2-thiouridine)(34)-methyltransferase MnmD [Bacteroidia bacterium]
MNFHQIRLLKTHDGSNSLFSEQFNTSFHSIFGAIEESKHVFIEQGLKPLLNTEQTEITILEIGFGTGLNTLLTIREVLKTPITINYHAVEYYPISNEIIDELNYFKDDTELDELFRKIHLQEWNQTQAVLPHFNLTKYWQQIENFKIPIKADVIYYDAFSPREQPELWTESIFLSMNSMLKSSGKLVTYCAQGQMKRHLKSAGFIVKALPGFANKREMTLAIKQT